MSGGGLIGTVHKHNVKEKTSPINYTPVRLVILQASGPLDLLSCLPKVPIDPSTHPRTGAWRRKE